MPCVEIPTTPEERAANRARWVDEQVLRALAEFVSRGGSAVPTSLNTHYRERVRVGTHAPDIGTDEEVLEALLRLEAAGKVRCRNGVDWVLA